tara:strand:+ start:595 stop:843 length:249 start_codon:yes stop_codon:yes gene_type:complete
VRAYKRITRSSVERTYESEIVLLAAERLDREGTTWCRCGAAVRVAVVRAEEDRDATRLRKKKEREGVSKDGSYVYSWILSGT